MIDLDEVLYGNPSWDKVLEYWKGENSFPSEEYSVLAIKKYLRTEKHRKSLYEIDLSIEDCLNGRYGSKEEPIISAIYKDWNDKLGFKRFG